MTDLELLPENVRSTANLFDLPMYYQYGIGSAGFGAWRELAAHIISTTWVMTNQFSGFPLLYHWRVLPDSVPQDVGAEFGGIDGAVAHWEGSAAVRGRLQAIAASTHSLVLFMEYVPQTLATWLAHNPAPQTWVEQGLAEAADFMSAHGMVHFDAHFHNVLTDGRSLFLADLGLALSRDFNLTPQEKHFLANHLDYDRRYVMSHLLLYHYLPVAKVDEPTELLRRWIAGEGRNDVPPEVADRIDLYARDSLALSEFHHRLLHQTKQAPYLRRAGAVSGDKEGDGGDQT
ncbi:hypothetical protein GCM10022223_55200 [Kineosporia mesophila]|uniref:Protein kinase domain-containing protein n=2 Tax=Kineosporia mesophila TaxID=566012 RepID=A0ABP7ADZ3_9ACTN|nr:hypothetical protein [Kineosporia mesophila]MCD5352824.1 hypothetical protein [Kineosporia mesophila]